MPDDDRKARLKALAARAGRTKQPNAAAEEGDDLKDDNDPNVAKAKPSLTFRNYAPKDTTLDDSTTSATAMDTTTTENNNDDDDNRRTKKPRIGDGTNDDPTTTTAKAKSGKEALQEALQDAQRDVQQNTTTSTTNSNRTTTTAAASGSVDVSAMAPQKIDADLKRGIADRLAKLERRTQRTIVEMLKERLELEAAQEVDDDDDVGGGGDSDLD